MRDWKEFRAPIVYGKSEILYEEADLAVLFVGHMAELAEAVRSRLKDKGYSCMFPGQCTVCETAGYGDA